MFSIVHGTWSFHSEALAAPNKQTNERKKIKEEWEQAKPKTSSLFGGQVWKMKNDPKNMRKKCSRRWCALKMQ